MQLTHADQRAAVVQLHSLTLKAVSAGADDLGNALVEGIAERNMANNASLEECERPDALCAVDDLVWDDEIARLDLLLQTADGGEGDDGADADGAQGGDVGPRGDLMGCDLVVQTVSAEEGNGDGLVLVDVVQDGDWGGRSAPRGLNVERGDLSEAWEFAQTSATDDRDTDGVYIPSRSAPCSYERSGD
jgi:hypothetical protein